MSDTYNPVEREPKSGPWTPVGTTVAEPKTEPFGTVTETVTPLGYAPPPLWTPPASTASATHFDPATGKLMPGSGAPTDRAPDGAPLAPATAIPDHETLVAAVADLTSAKQKLSETLEVFAGHRAKALSLMQDASNALATAQKQLTDAHQAFGGHKAVALQAMQQALTELDAASQFAKSQGR